MSQTLREEQDRAYQLTLEKDREKVPNDFDIEKIVFIFLPVTAFYFLRQKSDVKELSVSQQFFRRSYLELFSLNVAIASRLGGRRN